uniref:Uncharacterized protein n=1 Tax=Hyaloperonospora arabidopsidis (strain Emoy2) TaxID=559515 RepID=M4BQY6_HYAAE
MIKVGGWFKAKRVRVRAYFAEKNPVCTPSDRWWIYIMIAGAFAARATVTFKHLQGHSVTVSMQREHLKSLMLSYIECVSAKEVSNVMKSVTTLFINAINGIDEIVAERDPNNRGTDSGLQSSTRAPQDLVLIRNSVCDCEESEGAPSGALDSLRDRFDRAGARRAVECREV